MRKLHSISPALLNPLVVATLRQLMVLIPPPPCRLGSPCHGLACLASRTGWSTPRRAPGAGILLPSSKRARASRRRLSHSSLPFLFSLARSRTSDQQVSASPAIRINSFIPCFPIRPLSTTAPPLPVPPSSRICTSIDFATSSIHSKWYRLSHSKLIQPTSRKSTTSHFARSTSLTLTIIRTTLSFGVERRAVGGMRRADNPWFGRHYYLISMYCVDCGMGCVPHYARDQSYSLLFLSCVPTPSASQAYPPSFSNAQPPQSTAQSRLRPRLCPRARRPPC